MRKKRIIGTAYAQSCLEGYDPQYALSSDPQTCWMAEPYYQWWLMDCGSLCRIESICVRTGIEEGVFYRYVIEYSEDRINWTELCEKRDDEKPLLEGELYPADIAARYIRILMTYCSKGETVCLRDVVVTGEAIAAGDNSEQILDWRKRVRAASCQAASGFVAESTGELEPGWTDTMMNCRNGVSYLMFAGVDFDVLKAEQLRGMFRLPNKDKTLHLQVKICLDALGGTVIGNMDLHRQYTEWLQFACDLEPVTGVHDIYFMVTHVDAPQELGVLWLELCPRPVLSTNIVDHADEVVSEEGEFHAYLGTMHSHTGFSDGSKVPNYAYDHARYVAKMDFLGITEHSNLYDDTFDAAKSRKWRDIKQFAEEKTENGKFLALMGSETTWYNQFGHMNIYGADFFLNPYEIKYNDTSQYYAMLKKFPRVINQWNHPWSCGNRHLDMFEPYDAQLDEVMYTVEINSIELPENDGLFYYIHALDVGWHVSPVGSQDNHRPDWGTENSIRTGIVARRLTKADFYDAIRRHRTYYSCAHTMRLQYFVNGAIMGSVIPKTDTYRFEIQVTNDPQEAILDRIDILGEHGEVLASKGIDGHECHVTRDITNQHKYFFVKVFQKDGGFAATAPVWIEPTGDSKQ